jgi:hypothetical protein
MRRLFALTFGLLGPVLAAACNHEIIYQQQAPGSGGDTTTGDAGTTVAAPPPPVNLGSVTSGVDVPFTIPDGALGFKVVIDGSAVDYDPNHPMGIQRLTDPNGKVVLDNFTPIGGTNPTAIAEFDTIATVTIPQGEGTHPIPGTWKFMAGLQGNPTKQIKVAASVLVQSSGDAQFHGGKVDLHLHIPDGLKFGTTTITFAEAATSPDVNDRVTKFFALLSQYLQIDKGDVVLHQADSSLAAINDDQTALMGFSAAGTDAPGTQELHILYTNEIGENGKPVAVGFSPGIPGAGRGVSTILIQTSKDSNFDSVAMLHESGHFMGLNHTTEFTGGMGDPLSDTPLCTTMKSETPVATEMQQCPDKQNIMFPAGPFPLNSTYVLSPEQVLVYHGSTVYKAYAAGTQKTQSFFATSPYVPAPLHFRLSGAALSALDGELALGFCGLNKIDAPGMVARYGVDKLRAAAADPDLLPFMRGRAAVALERLGL